MRQAALLRGSSGKQEHATDAHVAYAFSCLTAHLHGRELPEPWFEDCNTALFVTWNIQSSHSDSTRLRGCIGTLEPRQLHTALKDYALTAALRDSRFPAIESRELHRLSCKVSLLSCFERAESWQDWDIGVHGIVIEFSDPTLHCRRSATFLPEVAGDQGWTKRETLDALIRKAGYSGRVDSSLLDRVTVTRYKSSVASLTWDEYRAAIHTASAAHTHGEEAAGAHVSAGLAAWAAAAAPQLVKVATHGAGA